MAKRHWKKLNPATTYVFHAENGWTLSMNADGTVNMAFKGTTSDASSVDLSISPDPGQGAPYPPTQP